MKTLIDRYIKLKRTGVEASLAVLKGKALSRGSRQQFLENGLVLIESRARKSLKEEIHPRTKALKWKVPLRS